MAVSAAPLVRLDVAPRAALIDPGTSVKLTATGDFADQKGAELPASYLTVSSSQPAVATVTADGRVRGVAEGKTVLLLSRGPVQAATVLNVGDTQDPILPFAFAGLQAYPAATALASPGGTRQLQVSQEGRLDLTAAETGTLYFAGNRDFLSVSPGGLMTALAPGDTSVTVISRGQELVLPVRVEAPRSGPATLGPDGGVVRAANGAVLAVPPGALAAGTPVSLEPLAEGELTAALPFPFTYVAGFRLDVGEIGSRQPLQLAVPVPAGTPAGSRVYFFRYGTVPDETGRERLSLFQDDTGVVGPDGAARTASPPWPGILKSGEYVVATADPSEVGELEIDVDLARPVEESDLEGLIVAAPVAAPPAPAAPLAGSSAGIPEAGFENRAIELITVQSDLGPIAVGVAVVTYAGVPLPGTLTLHLAYVVPKTVQNIEMIQIRSTGLPVITREGVQIDPGAATQITVSVINDRPPITDARFAPHIDQASLLFPQLAGGEVQPVLSLTGDRFFMDTEPKDLIIQFRQGGADKLVTDEDGNRNADPALGAPDVEVRASDPGIQYFAANRELRVPVPKGVVIGLADITLIAMHRDKNDKVKMPLSESNQVRLVQQRNYLFASLGIDQVAVVDGQATLPPQAPGTSPMPNPDFNKLVARIPVGDPAAFDSPRAVAVTGDGTRAYVSLSNKAGLAVVDALALQQVAPLSIKSDPKSRPFWVVVDDRNQLVYVSDETGYPLPSLFPLLPTQQQQYESNIYVFDINPFSDMYHKQIETLKVTGNAKLGLRGMALSSDGRRLYVAIAGAGSVGIFGNSEGFNGQVAIFNTDPADRKKEEEARLNGKPLTRSFLTQIATVDTGLRGETYGVTATGNPRRMLFTNRLIDSIGLALLEEDAAGSTPTPMPTWKIRDTIDLKIGYPGSSFDVNNARGVAVTPDLSYAFVTGFNLYIKDEPSHDPYVRPTRPAGGNIGIIPDPFRLYLVPGSARLAAGTRPIPWSFPDNLVISPDGRTLWAGYYGTHAIFAFDVDEIKKTVEGRVINGQTGRPITLDELQRDPIDDLNPRIDLKADYRRFDGIFQVPFDNPPGSNPRGPIASGGLPQGLAVQNNFLRLVAPLGVEPSRRPTFQWDFSGVEVREVRLYVSVFPAGQGLLPEDRFFQFPDPALAKRGLTLDLLSVNGDFNPNRIATETWLSNKTSHQLPPTHILTAGQTYYWAVEAISTTGQRNIKFGQFVTDRVRTQTTDAFSSVTIITHGFDLPSLTKARGVEQMVGKKFFQLGAQIARSGSLGPLNEPGGGLMMVYSRAGGQWIPVNEDGEAFNVTVDPNSFRGQPLVLINNWIQESFISESGFSEAAADAFFAALVQLDETTQKALFKSPIHLIGQSRGTVVTSELVQRLGTYLQGGSRPPDIQMTLLDPHDFKQGSLNIPIGILLKGLSGLGKFIKSPEPLGVAARVALELPTLVAQATDNETLWYGDFFEPKIQSWDAADFVDSYFQTVPVLEECSATNLAGCTTITPGGRDIPNTDIRGLMGVAEKDPERDRSRAGFTNDKDLKVPFTFGRVSYGAGRVHLRVFPWYAGTTDLSVRRFSFKDADFAFYQEDIFRRRSDLRYDNLFDNDFYKLQRPRRAALPWYSPDHVIGQQTFTGGRGEPSSVGDPNAPWEGIGTGWFHSILGGGDILRPRSKAARILVTTDNTTEGLEGDRPVPTVFNGNFDAGLRPFKRRFPILFYEIPGWSYHNTDQKTIPTFNIDSFYLFDRCPQERDSAKQCKKTSTATDEKKATNFALQLGMPPLVETQALLQFMQGAIQAAFPTSATSQALAQSTGKLGTALKLAGYNKLALPLSSALTEITHNRLYVPKDTRSLRLDLKILKASPDDKLVLSMLPLGQPASASLVIAEIPLEQESLGFTSLSFATPKAVNGNPVYLKAELKDSAGDGRLAQIMVDNIFLEAAFALKLTIPAANTNQIRVNDRTKDDLISTIYEETFDPDCDLTPVIGPIDEYPFSGPAKKQVKLGVEISLCQAHAAFPATVRVDWEIAGTQLKDHADLQTSQPQWFEITMPDKIGTYMVKLKLTSDNFAPVTIERKLFVTFAAPVTDALFDGAPRRVWYERAIEWAVSSADQKEDPLLEAVVKGFYSFGRAKLLYGYCFGGTVDMNTGVCMNPRSNPDYVDSGKCGWDQLLAVENDTDCNYSDCHIFSQSFQGAAETLGIAGLQQEVIRGSNGVGFITTTDRSLDSNFKGTALERYDDGQKTTVQDPDRFSFGNHNLRIRNGNLPYYDATFGKVYQNRATEGVMWNYERGFRRDQRNDYYLPTTEGIRVYPTNKPSYDHWSDLVEYVIPGSMPPAPSPAPGPASPLSAAPAGSPTASFTGNVTFTKIDRNGDGVAEALRAEFEVRSSGSERITILGLLAKGDSPVANGPRVDSELFSFVTLDGSPGLQMAALLFSGEQIFQSGMDGPYELELLVSSEGWIDATTVATPALDHRQFGELGAAITGVTESAVDADQDGVFDAIELDVEVQVRVGGAYRAHANLSKSGTALASAGASDTLGLGRQRMTLRFPARSIRRSGSDGPYKGVVTLWDAQGNPLSSASLQTRPYQASDFSALLELDGSLADEALDLDGNGLRDLLRLRTGFRARQAGTFLVSGVLRSDSSPRVVSIRQLATFTKAPQTILLDFPGSAIREQGLDGPYELELTVLDPRTLEELDQARVPQRTSTFRSADFDPRPLAPSITLQAGATETAVDTNGNGLFDELRVTIPVLVAEAAVYGWSAKLVAGDGTEIAFDARTASLEAGAAALSLVFDGEAIGRKGLPGPYQVKDLEVYSPGRDEEGRADVLQTQPYQASQFEGFQAP